MNADEGRSDQDALRELGPLALGSRLRRLSERLSGDAARFYRELGIEFEPRWFPLFHLLSERAPLSVSEAARALGVSHVAVSQTARELQRRRLLSSTRDPRDERRRRLQLTEKGLALLPRLAPIWRDFERATSDLVGRRESGLLAAIDSVERALSLRGFKERLLAAAQRRASAPRQDVEPPELPERDVAGHVIRIVPFAPEHVAAVTHLVVGIQAGEFSIPITGADQPELADIESAYRPGIFLVALNAANVVGTIGLMDFGGGQGALRKMFVHPDYRGAQRGVARGLLEALLSWARQHEIRDLYLGTVDVLHAAHRFYEKSGFESIVRADLPSGFPLMQVDTRFYHLSLESQPGGSARG